MGPLAVLCYHRVLPEEARAGEEAAYFTRGTAVTYESFRQEVASLARCFTVVDEAAVLSWVLGRHHAPAGRPLCWITVDDGYRDIYEAMYPVLAERGMPATAFLVSSLHRDQGRCLPVDRWYAVLHARTRHQGTLALADGETWTFDLQRPDDYARLIDGPEKRVFLRASPSEREAILTKLAMALGAPGTARPRAQYLTVAQLAELVDAGWTLGSHSVTHPLLTDLSEDGARQELDQSRREIIELGLEAPRSFAYPDGDWKPELWPLVSAAGYDAALTIRAGVLQHEAPRYALPRYIVPDDPEWVERTLLPNIERGALK